MSNPTDESEDVRARFIRAAQRWATMGPVTGTADEWNAAADEFEAARCALAALLAAAEKGAGNG